MGVRIFYTVLVLAQLCSICHCQSIYNASDLIDDLLTNYKTVLRPKINQSEALRVNFTLELLSVINFDEVHGSLYINAVVCLGWIDERLTWDPTNYNGLSSVMIESNKLYTPMVVHMNTIEKTEKVGSDDPWQLIRVSDNGQANYYPGGLLSSSCNADVTYYPFDSHICSIQFIAWGFLSSEIQLIPIVNEVGKNYYSPNGVWELTGSKIRTFYDGVQVQVDLNLRRKPLFVIFNVMLPIMLMTLLNTIVFLIPTDSGERISYSITMLLAIAVFLTLVGDNLPKTSNPMSVFSYYLLLILTLGVLSVAANIISLRCYFTSEQEQISSNWKKFITISRCKFLKKCRSRSIHAEKELGDGNCGEFANNANRNIQSASNANTDTAEFVSLDHVDNIDSLSWKDVSCALDRICFVVSLALTVCITLVVFVTLYASSKN